jgi:TRAP-type mannitol/chloroaromatic compound transport system permease large subunit
MTRLVNDVQRLTRADRVALIDDTSCSSRVLHRRHVAATISTRQAISIELILAVVGAILIALGGAKDSNVLGAIGAFAWMAALQPLIKYERYAIRRAAFAADPARRARWHSAC